MRQRFGIVLVIAVTMTACGRSPKTHFYTLDAVPAAPRAEHAARSDAPVTVGRVELPGTLDRLSIVTRGDRNQVSVSDQDRWAAPLDELVRRALTDDLRMRLPPGTVLAPGDGAPNGARSLALNVQHFMADQSGRVDLDAEWTLQRRDKPGAPQHAAIQVNATGQDDGATAAAMSQALGELADRIAAEL